MSKLHPRTKRRNQRGNRHNQSSATESLGTAYLMRASLMSKVTTGLWTWNPLGLKVRRKIEKIIREELEEIGALELELPIMPTKYMPEEMITSFANQHLLNHKDLPVIFWSIHTKPNNVPSTNQGWIYGKESRRQDAYSFAKNAEEMQLHYQQMREVYQRIFTRCQCNHLIEIAVDHGIEKGKESIAFVALTDAGDPSLLHCSQCGYQAHQDMASTMFHYPTIPLKNLEKRETRDIKSVADLSAYLKLPAQNLVKTIILMADAHPVIVSIRGDLTLSETKLARILNAQHIQMAPADVVEILTQTPVGFAGPIPLIDQSIRFQNQEVPYLFDKSLQGLQNFTCGANEHHMHYLNVNAGRDFTTPSTFYDLAKVTAGHACPCCEGTLQYKNGIELGYLFQLEQIYSSSMKAHYRSLEGQNIPYWMGSYGIDIARIMQTLAEQYADDKGIKWPRVVAPFEMVVLPVHKKLIQQGTEVYQQLRAVFGAEIAFDDLGRPFGASITDAELIGYPISVVVSRRWQESQQLEIRVRASGEVHIMGLTELIQWWQKQRCA